MELEKLLNFHRGLWANNSIVFLIPFVSIRPPDSQAKKSFIPQIIPLQFERNGSNFYHVDCNPETFRQGPSVLVRHNGESCVVYLVKAKYFDGSELHSMNFGNGTLKGYFPKK